MSNNIDLLLAAMEASNHLAPPPYTIEKLDILNGVRFNHSLSVLTFEQVRGLVNDAIAYQQKEKPYMTLIEVEGVPFAITAESDSKSVLKLLGIHVYRNALHKLRYEVNSEAELILWLDRYQYLGHYFEGTRGHYSDIYSRIHNLLGFNAKTHDEVDAYIANMSNANHRILLGAFKNAWITV